MKKTLALVLALMLVAAFAMTAMAAPAEKKIQTAGGYITVKVIDDFSGHGETDSFASVANSTFTYDGANLVVEGIGGALWHADNNGAQVPADADTLAAWGTATYVGYQITLENEGDILLVPESMAATSTGENEWGTLMQNHNEEADQAEWPVVLVTADGKTNAAEKEAGNYRAWGPVIPGGFSGWVFFPIARLNASENDGFHFKNIYFYSEFDAAEGLYMEVDNLALAENLDVTEGQVDPGDEPGGNDEPQGTADISTIAFALAAVVSSGALIIRKKR